MSHNDQGMGVSLAVYAFALLGALALFVLPVLWASGGTVYENPGAKAVSLPGGPTYASRAQFPLALLKRPPIVDQAALNELNAKSVQKAPAPHRVASRSAHRSYAQASEEDGQRPARRSFFPWF